MQGHGRFELCVIRVRIANQLGPTAKTGKNYYYYYYYYLGTTISDEKMVSYRSKAPCSWMERSIEEMVVVRSDIRANRINKARMEPIFLKSILAVSSRLIPRLFNQDQIRI